MKKFLLSLDTTGEAVSVALTLQTGTYEHYLWGPRQAANRILPMLDALLEQQGCQMRDCTAIGVTNGPGSFTGVRLGISIAQGLAFGIDCPVVSVTSLSVLAQAAFSHDPEQETALVAIDARKDQIYWACYQKVNGLPVCKTEIALSDPDQIEIPKGDYIAIGSGFREYAVLRESLAAGVPVLPHAWPRARYVAPLAQLSIDKGQCGDAKSLAPLYIRDQIL